MALATSSANFVLRSYQSKFFHLVVWMMIVLHYRLSLNSPPTYKMIAVYTCTVMVAKSSWIKTSTFVVHAMRKASTEYFTKCTHSTQRHTASSTTLAKWNKVDERDAHAKMAKNACIAPTAPDARVSVTSGLLCTIGSWIWTKNLRYLRRPRG